jgi:hypothetical protein
MNFHVNAIREHRFRFTKKDVLSMAAIAVVNKIVIPCLAISVVSSLCFYYALVASPPVRAEYTYCAPTTSLLSVEYKCLNVIESAEDNVSYTPPYLYSYQCSAAFYTDYVPVFIYMFVWSSIIVPLIVLAAEKVFEWQDRLERATS